MSLVALSGPEPVSGYATVGVTWRAEDTRYKEGAIAVQIRTKTGTTWSAWGAAIVNAEESPSPKAAGEGAGTVRSGTDPLVVGEVDWVQVRMATADGKRPPDVRLAVIDPGMSKQVMDAPEIDGAAFSNPGVGVSQSVAHDAQSSVTLSAMRAAPRPPIYSRAQWGANERLRDQSAPTFGTVKAGFIHHTVNANNYTEAQVPALIRGIYAYHTQSKGWRDIGYNFLVDRFGRIWEGRYGGVNRAVVGAHTLGYNQYSFAISAIGNFDTSSPPRAVLIASARLIAWKLSLNNIRAGSHRIPVNGRWLRAINGHRDVGTTACPGRYLYARVPAIRRSARRIQNVAQARVPAPTLSPTTPTESMFTRRT